MAKARAKRSALERAVRDLLVEKAKAKFKSLFRTEYDPAWGAGVLAAFQRLHAQDDAVRRLAPNVRRTPNRVRKLVRAHGLEHDPFQPGTAPSLVSMAVAAGGDNNTLKRWFISDDPVAAKKRFASFRISVVEFFESVPANTKGKRGSFGDVGRWKAEGFNDRRILTDGELVAIMICIAPESVTLFEADLDGMPKDIEQEVRRRERRQMRDTRRRWGSEPAVRTPDQRAAERKKKAILPWPQGRTT